MYHYYMSRFPILKMAAADANYEFVMPVWAPRAQSPMLGCFLTLTAEKQWIGAF
jgi:hypothetical protein